MPDVSTRSDMTLEARPPNVLRQKATKRELSLEDLPDFQTPERWAQPRPAGGEAAQGLSQ